MSRDNKLDIDSLGLIGYFDQQVLASYRNEPQKFEITSDNFEGMLTITEEYYAELEAAGRTDEYVRIRFGYRALHDGDLAIAALLPDLFEKSKAHIQKWSGFHLKNPEWTRGPDQRFESWLRRYIEGSWDVDNGPLFYLGQTMKVINGCTSELVGIPLFKHEIDKGVGYPAAENSHRYQDAHRILYGYLIDGLDKSCIAALAFKQGRTISVADKKTVDAICKLFPTLDSNSSFLAAAKLISEQRRLASHGRRSKPVPFPGFSTFTADLRLCVAAAKEILAVLQTEFKTDGEKLNMRHEAKKWLPVIVRPPNAHFSIVQARRMVGKTVGRVEVGFREDISGVHGSEAIIIHFTDGSVMGIDSGSNAGNLASSRNDLRPEDFLVDFMISWVPESPSHT